jgi:hypothetical protein
MGTGAHGGQGWPIRRVREAGCAGKVHIQVNERIQSPAHVRACVVITCDAPLVIRIGQVAIRDGDSKAATRLEEQKGHRGYEAYVVWCQVF